MERGDPVRAFFVAKVFIDGFPADTFWIEYRVNGKRIKQRLLDNVGNPIKKIRAAQKEFDRIIAPFVTADKKEQLKMIRSKLVAAEAEHALALDEANPPLRTSCAWREYLHSAERPDTGKATLKYYA